MTAAPVVLVEDRADDALLTRRAFTKAGFDNELVVLGDGEACLDAFLPPSGARGLEAALLLLDVNLPKIGGLEVLHRIRADERTRYLPVVMLTTSGEQRDITASYQLGANGYVCKPISYAAFAETVDILGRYWLAINRSPSAPAGRDPRVTLAQ